MKTDSVSCMLFSHCLFEWMHTKTNVQIHLRSIFDTFINFFDILSDSSFPSGNCLQVYGAVSEMFSVYFKLVKVVQPEDGDGLKNNILVVIFITMRVLDAPPIFTLLLFLWLSLCHCYYECCLALKTFAFQLFIE